jgi:hypothetical protein
MEATLERLLLDLSDETNGADPANIVDNIEALVLSDVSVSETELSVNLILKSESPPSLIHFVNKFIRSKDKALVKAKIGALKFIYRYLKLVGKYFDRFALSSVTMLLDIWRREDSGEVRAALLLPIKIIFKYCQRFGYSENLGSAEALDSRLEIMNVDAVNLAEVYDKLLEDLKHNKKTLTKTGKSEIFKILGMLVGSYPEADVTATKVSIIVDYALWSLDQNFKGKDKDVEPSVIAGIFSCLDRICYSFDHVVFAASKSKATVFEYLLKAVSAVTQGDISRFAMSSKALRFLKNHSSLFQELIATHARQAYRCVYDCYKSGKEGVYKHSEDTLLKIVDEISASICESVDQRKKSTPAASILEAVLTSEAGKGFTELVQEHLSYLNAAVDVDKLVAAETSFTAKAISMIAPCIAILEQIGYVNKVFGNIALNIIQTSPATVAASVMNNESSYYEIPASWSIKHVHLFYSVTCLANQTASAGSIRKEIVSWLLETAVDAMTGYNKLTKKYQWILTKALVVLSRCGLKAFRKEYLEVFIPALFLRSVSRGNIGNYSNYANFSSVDAGQDTDGVGEEAEQSVVLKPLVQDYIPLWINLFNPTDKALLFQFMKMEVDYKSSIGAVMFNQFFVTMVKFMRSLNMEYSIDTSDGREIITPNNPVDQGIIYRNIKSVVHVYLFADLAINLASLVENVVIAEFSDISLRWLPLLIPELIEKSLQYPMVSTFYNILSNFFRVLGQCESMVGQDHQKGAHESDPVFVPMDFDSYLDKLHSDDESQLAKSRIFFGSSELRPMMNRITGYVTEIKSKLSSFHDELLSACLRLILHAPRIILTSIDDYVEPICLALETGFQVELALKILDVHISRQESKRIALVQHLPRVLKLLEPYLISPDEDSESQKSVQFNTKLAIRLRFLSSSSSQELFSIQRSVMRIVGRLGGFNQLIIPPQEEVLKSSLAWSVNHDTVSVKLPLLGLATASTSRYLTQRMTQSTTQNVEVIEVTVALDRLLPRIVELATSQSSSTDKHAKLAAAESLHAIVTLLIGTAATSPDRKDKGDSVLAKIYSKLFHAVIDLSVDADPMCGRLFDKLLFQIVHWFSGPRQVHEAEAASLIDSLIDGLCVSNDAQVRNQCSRALGEFFHWSIKQSSKKDVANSGLSADSLLTRLFVIAVHSNTRFRVGATAVFQKIYVYFREETNLVSKYLLQIVSTLLKSMQLGGSEADNNVRSH